MQNAHRPSRKSTPINRSHRRNRADSKFSKMPSISTKASALPSIEDIAKRQPCSALPQLRKKQEMADNRSHQFLHRMNHAGYRVASRLAGDPAEWAKFCENTFWNDAKQPPEIEFPETALRHVYLFIFGKGDSRAYQSYAKLKSAFKKGTPPEEVEKALYQDPVEKPAKEKVVREKYETIAIKRSGTFEGGVFEAGRASVPFTIPKGYTARVSLKVALTRIRGRYP